MPLPISTRTLSYNGILSSSGSLAFDTSATSKQVYRVSRIYYEFMSEKPGNVQVAIAGKGTSSTNVSPLILTGPTLRRGFVRQPKSSDWIQIDTDSTIHLGWLTNVSDNPIRYNISIIYSYKFDHLSPSSYGEAQQVLLN